MLYDDEIWEVTKEEERSYTIPPSSYIYTETHFSLKRPLRDGFYITVGWGVRESLCKEVYKEVSK